MSTLTEAQARLARYIAAETAILKNQSYTIGTRTYTRANLKWIQTEIEKLRAEVKVLSGGAGMGTMKVRRIIFRDD